ncbi:importin-5-like [Populus alba x Populus x berolinensis]|nr:importin-5-like [Populus alba x Populus x berolinensis]
MQEEKHMIKGETLKVLSAVAYSSQDQFAEYYSTVMPYLKAWSRLGKCLGKEFKPYMSVSIPRLLRSAKIGSYVLIPENPDSVDESDGSIRAMILGERKIWIKTTVLEEKVAACKGLYLLADELKEGLSVWIEEVAQTLVPFLNFQFNEEIRRVAASAMPVLLKSSKEAIQKGNLELSDESPFEKLCSDAKRKPRRFSCIGLYISSCNGLVLILGTARSYFKESFTVDSIQALGIYLWA